MPPIPLEILDLAIQKTHTGSFAPGGQGSWLLTVSNAGTIEAPGPVTVTDVLNPPMLLVSASGNGWDCSASQLPPPAPGQVSCTHPGPVALGGQLPPITVVVSIPAGAPPSVLGNAATVSTDGDVNTENNTASDVVRMLGPAPAPVASREGILALIAVLCAAAWFTLRRART